MRCSPPPIFPGRQLTNVTVPAKDLVVRPILRERLILAVHQSHPFAERTSVRLAELAGEPFLTFPRHRVSRLYDHIAALCHHAGFRLEIAQEAVQFPTLLGLAAANTGVTIVPASLRALNLAELRYVELADPEATSTLSIAYRADRQPPATVRDFLDITSAIDIP